jgi:hypothetical protein
MTTLDNARMPRLKDKHREQEKKDKKKVELPTKTKK